MNPTAILALSILAAGAAAFTVVELRGNAVAPATTGPAADGADLAALRREVAALRAELDGLRAAAPAAAPSGRAELPVVTDSQVAAALERYLAAHGGRLPADAAAGAAAAIDVKAVFDALRKDSMFWSNPDSYKAVHAAGKMDELIAMFEQNAAANPNDANAQWELGNAYLAWLQLDQTKWQLSMKADEQYDKVLALDENHWAARFTKAVSYTFWPDFLGKKKEAIAHFERLIEQQDRMPIEDGHAETYLYLGNLLEQRGENERAREVWQRGLRRHPNSRELREKLGR
jgi:tetratricopeptide (TPR) repeat protein